MSVLDDTFTFYKKMVPGDVPTMEATLVGTKLPSLAGFLATAGGARRPMIRGLPQKHLLMRRLNTKFILVEGARPRYQLRLRRRPAGATA
jgi:hypothetical protein